MENCSIVSAETCLKSPFFPISLRIIYAVIVGKRPRSFQLPQNEVTHCPILETPLPSQASDSIITPTLSAQFSLLERQHDIARAERDLPLGERDRVLKKQNSVVQAKDLAMKEHNQAIIERDLAISRCNELKEQYEEKSAIRHCSITENRRFGEES
jgi:hypothetical protein